MYESWCCNFWKTKDASAGSNFKKEQGLIPGE